MRKHNKKFFTAFLAGVMLAQTALSSSAATIEAGTLRKGTDFYSGPGAASQDPSSQTAAQLTSPSGQTSSQTTSSAVSSSAADTSQSQTLLSEASSDAQGQQTADSAAAADASMQTELSEQDYAELAEEHDAGQEDSAGTEDPLTVPKRSPRLTTVLLNTDTMAWTNVFLNSEQMTTGESPFSSVSTYIEDIRGDIIYRVYRKESGWTDWAYNGAQTPGGGDLHAVKAVQYRFAGPVANDYDLYYCTTISDGTTTGYAKNGETSGVMGYDLFLTGMKLLPVKKGDAAPDTSEPMKALHADGIQYIDGQLKYINGNGNAHTGWGWLGNDRYYFTDGNAVTGWQYIDGYKYYFDENGKLVQDIEYLLPENSVYRLRINKTMNCMTVYTKDSDGRFIVPVKSFLTSVGDDTPLGTFSTPEKFRWKLMIHDVYTQYATRLGKGLNILIHSIIYDAPNPYTVWASTYNYMGIAKSAGCIRLVSGDAKWVYDHCPLGTSVEVYESSDPGPFERPTILYEIPFEQTWDPSDPNVTEEGIAAESARIRAAYAR